MKFNEYKYSRPSIDDFINNMDKILSNIATDKSLDIEISSIYKAFDLLDEIDTLRQLVGIRNNLNINDVFYQEERKFFNEFRPLIEKENQKLIDKILKSKYRLELIDEFGEYLFKKYEVLKKTFSEDVIPLLQRENELKNKYEDLMASAKVMYNDKLYNLSQMREFGVNKDREVRHNAQLAISNWLNDNESTFDDIFDELVKLRDKISKELGYGNFIELAYNRLARVDYNSEDVANYRNQIYEIVVPYVDKLIQRKAKRLKIDDLKSYDLLLSFIDGNPLPLGDTEYKLSQAKIMYEEISLETGEFFNYMINHDLLNFDMCEGKLDVGYCTYIPGYNSPFIFSNFNNTSNDLIALTHEAGHAFQVFQSKNLIPEYRWPSYEAAEICSMGMEFLTWPWLDKFFGNDSNKFKFNHLSETLIFIAYGMVVDEFQHGIYENVDMSKEDRKTLWRKIEKKYMPYKDYDDDCFLNKGTYWYRQWHVFCEPFYYIDYTLAQIVSFEYWVKSQSNYKEAFSNYLELCKLGGSKSFVSLLNTAKLSNPFEDGVIKKTIMPIIKYLDSIDDCKL